MSLIRPEDAFLIPRLTECSFISTCQLYQLDHLNIKNKVPVTHFDAKILNFSTTFHFKRWILDFVRTHDVDVKNFPFWY